MTGRTVAKHARVYVAGLDMSGFTRSIGPLAVAFDEEDETTLSNEMVGFLPGMPLISPGPLSTALDNTASTGPHVNFSANDNGQLRDYLAAIGDRAAPVAGDIAFMGQFEQMNYKAQVAGGVSFVDMDFNPSARGATLLYGQAWGHLHHALGAETAVNTGTADKSNGASSAFGGFMVYHAPTANGTATIKIQDSSTNIDANFGDLVSSGVIDPSAAPVSGLVPLGKTATVEDFTRWQIVLGTATTVTFVVGFVRGR